MTEQDVLRMADDMDWFAAQCEAVGGRELASWWSLQASFARVIAPEMIRHQRISDDQIIAVLVPNPKRRGSACHERFSRYENGMTVGEALERGITRTDLRWDLRHNFIDLV